MLPKHAQHVVLIHFPIALFIAGVVFDLLGRGRRLSLLAGAAYLNFSAAAIMVFPAVATGLLAWQFVLEGKRLKGLLLLHLIAASCAAVMILASWWVHRRARKFGPSVLPGYRIAVELLGVAVLALT
ncbi:MAG TPA: DUF2231 domain-containing protein, partial [Terriglobales bacterium]|nr:DUF2231 domain-containing protein [Terriglobales bacterium]